MASRRDPAAAVVTYFETAPIDTARTVLAICRSVMAKRLPPKKTGSDRARKTTTSGAAGGTDHHDQS